MMRRVASWPSTRATTRDRAPPELLRRASLNAASFALASIAHAHGLPPSVALVLFAAARLTGWLAHALEQQAQGRLIRPRARYVGTPAPDPAA